MKTLFVATAVVVALSSASAAQQHHPQQHGAPYAGMQHRPVKALSDQQLADLRAGRGMGLALAAELNGYPGPLHVIELADQLGLSAEAKQRMADLFQSMKAEAVAEGEKLIVAESGLDRAFADRTISPNALARLTAEIGVTQARLREVHLKYHLATADLLSPDQRRRYAELRGYR